MTSINPKRPKIDDISISDNGKLRFILPDEISFHVINFLDITDLMSLEQVTKKWREVIKPMWQLLLNSPLRKHLTYKIKKTLHNQNSSDEMSNIFAENNISSFTLTPKQFCKYINRKRSCPQFLILGGTFGDNNEQLCAFNHDISDDKLIGGPIYYNENESLNLPVKGLGSTSAVMSKYGFLTLLGGWDAIDEMVIEEAYRINIYDYFKQFSLSNSYYNDYQQFNDTNIEDEIHASSNMKCGTWYQSKLLQESCFSSTTMLTNGSLICSGGCNSPYKGSTVYDDFYLIEDNNPHFLDFELMINLKILHNLPSKRCGHSTVVTFDNNIVMYGGYSGGNEYCETGYLYDMSKQMWLELPDMNVKRSGFISVLDGHGSIIVCGGSPDGLACHRSAERLDLRMNKFQKLSDMNMNRGYTAGCIGVNNIIYAFGGLYSDESLSQSAEFYDPRMDKWINLDCSSEISYLSPSPSLLPTTNTMTNTSIISATNNILDESYSSFNDTIGMTHTHHGSNNTIGGTGVSTTKSYVSSHVARACHQVLYLS